MSRDILIVFRLFLHIPTIKTSSTSESLRRILKSFCSRNLYKRHCDSPDLLLFFKQKANDYPTRRRADVTKAIDPKLIKNKVFHFSQSRLKGEIIILVRVCVTLFKYFRDLIEKDGGCKILDKCLSLSYVSKKTQ